MKNNKNNKNIGHPFNTITSISLFKECTTVFSFQKLNTRTHTDRQRGPRKRNQLHLCSGALLS